MIAAVGEQFHIDDLELPARLMKPQRAPAQAVALARPGGGEPVLTGAATLPLTPVFPWAPARPARAGGGLKGWG